MGAPAASARRGGEGVRRSLRKLLIANRGEIARRIARTAHRMGIRTVAVFADGDREAPFVRELDEAFSLDGRTAAETYLDADKLLAIARRSGADAVHPGYGFLSENAEFARAVQAAGLLWVGPEPEAIAAMGDKVEAKRRLAGTGVPLLPSVVLEERCGPAELAAAADEIGLPLLVKASAGGGGKGMRVVRRRDELADAVAAAQREAQAAFGSPRVFLERFIERARHVEIQLLGDRHGELVHCFERECSIQRRHQKIVEEAPSPAVDEALRRRMGEAAIAVGRVIGYSSTGTVEFLLEDGSDAGDAKNASDGEPAFWFLEMNTRLQVEHPVSEAITGLDLVREQLRVARGEPLGLRQEDLQCRGHAVEVRLYAEDPAASFLPTTGVLERFEIEAGPDAGADPGAPGAARIRVDSGVESGSVVGIEFDPMLAKVVAHAPTREEAALALARALENAVVQGVVTNRDFLVAMLRSEAFLAGDTTIDFIERVAPPRRREVAPRERADAALLATFAAVLHRRAAARVQRSIPSGWRNTVMPPEEVRFAIATGGGADRVEVAVAYRARRDGGFVAWVEEGRAGAGDERSGESPGLWELQPAGEAQRVELLPGAATTGGAETLSLLVDGRRVRGVLHGATPRHPHGLEWGPIWVSTAGLDLELRALPRFPEAQRAERRGDLHAPMPGKVLAVHVQAGDRVEEGQLLMLLEAMKMEHRVVAPHTGEVTELAVAAGDQVAAGAQLAHIEASTEGAAEEGGGR